ncbi:hypothetical protein QNE50_002302 [Vibrio parahaemolyticus]|nr:hypothetical protein [Vibrio parahaemolyticus]HCE3067271.1 hypothetical protein [Vibrio parahaemolyticus]
MYSANLPREKYIKGKRYTQRIERVNLTPELALNDAFEKRLLYPSRKKCTIRCSVPSGVKLLINRLESRPNFFLPYLI